MSGQVFIPMLSYEDGLAAMDWLKLVFGFEERERWLAEDGTLSHGELASRDQVLMLATPGPQYKNPKQTRTREMNEISYVMDGVLVYVDDVNKTFDMAKSRGATILSEIETGFPGTRFRMEDPEGHRWFVLEVNAS